MTEIETTESPDTQPRDAEHRRTARSDERTATPGEGGSQEVRCPECDTAGNADEARGERVCPDCGLVLDDELVDQGPEWRAYDATERQERRRVGAPRTELLHDHGLSSTIDWRDRDASGSQLTQRKRQQMQRLRTWDERFRARDARDRNLKQALGEISRMAAALGLPETVRETASVVYRRALEQDLLPGRSIEAMATASLYAAARQSGIPRTLDEFEPVSRVDRREFARAYRYVLAELGLAMAPPDPGDFLPRYASRLDVSDEIRRRAEHLLDAGKQAGVYSGKSPGGLCAAAIYAASVQVDDRITQSDVSEALDVSAVTIRKRYRELLEADGETP
ncbi:MAG: TFIIB-type zinc ribbon-containing protein [Haloarculaceae archaeon]